MKLDLGNLSLAIPKGFSTRMLVLAGPLEHMEDSDVPLRQNVMITCEEIEEGTSADDFADLQLHQLGAANAGFSVERRSSLSIAGETFPLVEARSQIPGGPDLVNLLAYVVRGGSAFTLSASDVAGPRYEAARPTFLSMFESFEAA